MWWFVLSNTHCGASIRYQRKQSLQIVDHFWRCFNLTYIIKSEVVKWKWSQRMWEVSNNMVYIIRGSGLSRTLVVRRCLDLKGRIKPHHNIIILTCNLPYHQLCQYYISDWNVLFFKLFPNSWISSQLSSVNCFINLLPNIYLLMRNNNFLPDKTSLLKLDAVFVYTIVNILFRRHPKCFVWIRANEGQENF